MNNKEIKNDYVIAGDSPNFTDCLVCTCGTSLKLAQKVLQRMLTNPNENDKLLMKGLKNFRIQEVPRNKCWWNDNCE